MGTSRPYRDRLLMQALAASIALHLLLASLVPALALLHQQGPPIETISFLHVVRISIATAPPVRTPRPASAPLRARIVTTVVPHMRSRRPPARRYSASRPVAQHAATSAPVAGNPAVGASMMPPPPRVTALPSATPAAEHVASVENRSQVGGYMPFGAQEPNPVLDPQAFHALAALKIHVTLTVDVDAQGHTKSVGFDPPLDKKSEDQIRSMLADAAWDPAVCGAGIACEGRTTITL